MGFKPEGTSRLKPSCRVATTANVANLAAGAPDPVDGVSLAVGDRVLVLNQSTASENGIYRVVTVGTGADGSWVRAADADQDAEVRSGDQVYVREGTQRFLHQISTVDPITVGSTSIAYETLGEVRGGGTANHIAYFSGANTLASEAAGELYWDPATDRLGVGSSTPLAPIHVIGDSSNEHAVFGQHSSDAVGGSLRLRKSRGTEGSPSIISDGDDAPSLVFEVYDGATYQSVARVAAAVDGAPGAGDTPGRLEFYTTPDGSSTLAERMRIDDAGNVLIGTTTASALLDVDGSAIFNKSGAAVDFVVEGDTDPSLIFAAGALDSVGIGIAAPGAKLHVFGGSFRVDGPGEIGGPLTVEGPLTTIESEKLHVASNYPYINDGYTADTAVTGGLVVNYDPSTTTDSSVVAPPTATTITTVGSATFTAGDYFQISGSVDNDGIYRVLTHTGTTLTIATTGDDFIQTSLSTSDGSTITLTGVAVSVLRSGTDGLWEEAAGSTGPLTFTDLGSILTDGTGTLSFDGSGNLSETGVVSFSMTPSGAITLTAGASSTWSVTGGAQLNLTVEKLASTSNYLLLNSEYTGAPVQGTGLIAITNTGSGDTVAGAYVAGVPATSNPTVTTTGSGTFSQHDIVQISGSTNNDGLYEVEDHTGTTLTIKGIGTTPTLEDWSTDDFVAGASDGATIENVAIAVWRTNTTTAYPEYGIFANTTASGFAFDIIPLIDPASIANGQIIRATGGSGQLTSDAGFTWNGSAFAADGSATFNDSGAATADFRVEGNNRANLLFIDADGGTDGRVGINRTTGNVGATLDVDNLSASESILILRDSGTAVVTVADGGATTFTQNVVVEGTLIGQREVETFTEGADPAPGTAEARKAFSNEGATAQAGVTLPTAAAGLEYTFIVQDADGIQITAAAGDTIRQAGSVSTTGGTATSTTIGDTITLLAINATEWFAIASHGTWTLA